MKQLHIITCQPNDIQFYWQTFVQLNNARNLGVSNKFRILVFEPKEPHREAFKPKWKKLEETFPETKFFFYSDESDVMSDVGITGYIPLLRPYILARHFKDHPELENDAIFYIDGDVLFTKELDWIDKYVQDDVNYLSDTKSYLNSDYFDSKGEMLKDENGVEYPRFLRPEMVEEYKTIDVLDQLVKPFGLSRAVCEKYKNATGGAQSLLKNVNSKFWQDVYQGAIFIRQFLLKVNAEYFPNENEGFQSWCADMWSLLFNIWKNGGVTETPKDFDFCWATDEIGKIEHVNMYHNAGITGEQKIIASRTNDRTKERETVEALAFYKGKRGYVNNEITPFEDDEYIISIIEHPVSQHYATHYYAVAIYRTKEEFNL